MSSAVDAFRTLQEQEDQELTKSHFFNSPVLFHDVLKRPQKVLLEPEVGQLALLQKLHGQLPKRVHGEDGHVLVGAAADLHGGRTGMSDENPAVSFSFF